MDGYVTNTNYVNDLEHLADLVREFFHHNDYGEMTRIHKEIDAVLDRVQRFRLSEVNDA